MIHHTLIIDPLNTLLKRMEPCFQELTADQAHTDLASLDSFLFEERSVILKDPPEFKIRKVDQEQAALKALKTAENEGSPFDLVILKRTPAPAHGGQELLGKVRERYPNLAMLLFYEHLADFSNDLHLHGPSPMVTPLPIDASDRLLSQSLQNILKAWLGRKELLQRRDEHDQLFQELQESRRQGQHAVRELNHLEKKLIGLERDVLDKDQLFSFFTYEMRTPLQNMRSQLDEIESTRLNEAQRSYLQNVHEGLDTLDYALESSLAFLSGGDTEIRLVMGIFNPRQIVDRIACLMQPHAYRRQNKISVTVESHVPDWVEGDVFRFKQILFHLVGNAIKYTRNGKVVIRLKEVSRNDFHSRIQFDIHDEGAGMDPGMITVLKHMFEEPPSSHSARAGHRGLHFCHNLAHAMGASIWFESELNMGTRFHLAATLPMAIGSQGDGKVLSTNKEPSALILLVEDDPTNQRVFDLHLKGTTHQVIHANTGMASLDLLEKHDFDLIFLDLNLPDLNGFEVSQLIRKKIGPELPIIAVTANVLESHRARCKESGMNDFVAKPVTRHLLLKIIQAHMSNPASVKKWLSEVTPNRVTIDKPLDYEVGVKEFCGDAPVFETVLSQFLQVAKRDLILCITAIQNQDLSFIGDKCHIIAGGAGNLCANFLALAAQHCEQCAINGALNKTTEALFDVFRCFGQLEEYSRTLGIQIKEEPSNENSNN